jgi:hypothetical protein
MSPLGERSKYFCLFPLCIQSTSLKARRIEVEIEAESDLLGTQHNPSTDVRSLSDQGKGSEALLPIGTKGCVPKILLKWITPEGLNQKERKRKENGMKWKYRCWINSICGLISSQLHCQHGVFYYLVLVEL